MATLLEQIQNKRKQIQQRSGNTVRTRKPQPGKNAVFILPGWDGPDTKFFHDFGMHWIRQPGEQKPEAAYICTDRTFGKPCAICEAIADMKRNTHDDDVIQALRENNAAPRMLFNALFAGESEPCILEVPLSVGDEILATFEEWPDIIDPANCRAILIERTGSGLSTRYSTSASSKTAPINAGILSQIKNLDEYCDQEYEEGLNRALASVNKAGRTLLGHAAPIRELNPPTAAPAGAGPADFDDDDFAFDADMGAEEPAPPASEADDDLLDELFGEEMKNSGAA